MVEAGSLTAAAAELRMSQPPLSLAISKFEAELGVQLLTRSPQGVAPTSAGRYLLESASRILGEVSDTRARLKSFGTGSAGVITVAAVPVLMHHRIPMLLSAHHAKHPDVVVRLTDPPPWTAIDLLLDRKVDIAMVMVADGRRFANRHRSELGAIPWGVAPLVAALPPTSAPEPGRSVSLQIFHRQPVVLPKRTLAVPSLPDVVESALDREYVLPSEIFASETIQTSIPLIQASMAGSVIPDPDLRSWESVNGLALRPLSPSLPPLDILVLVRRHRQLGGGLLDRLLETIRNLPLNQVSKITMNMTPIDNIS